MSCRRAGFIILAGMLLLALASGCNTGIAEHEAERRVEQRLPTLIGPAESYHVDIRASSDLSVIGGRLREITIKGSGVRISRVWPVDSLLVTLERVRFDTHRQALQEVGAARFQVMLSPTTLMQYLQEETDSVRNVRIRLASDQFTVSGSYRVLRVWAPFQVSGRLRLLDKYRIGFEPDTARAVGVPVPGRVMQYLEKRLNPILDVSDTPLPLELTAVHITPEGITVSGIPHLDDPSLLTATPHR